MKPELDALVRRWDLAVHHAQFAVWDLDLEADLVHYPPEWKRLLGYAPTDMADPTAVWRARVHPDDLAGMVASLQDHIDGRSDVYEHEFRICAADGGWHWMLSRGRAVERDAAGRARRVVGTLVDHTDRRAAERLRVERDRAEAASRAKTEFLARMSHELRTPLNAVLGFAQLLQATLGPQADPAVQRQYVEHIERAGWHLLAMIEDVLDLSRVEAGQLALHASEVSVPELVAETCGMLGPQADQAEVTMRVEPALGVDRVLVDGRRLRQVLTNLLSNAIKYNRPGGLVSVRLRAHGDEWTLEVADTGLGLPAARRGELFQPFSRLGRERSGVEGVGIGLLLVRWLVDRMGGRIDVDSVEGEGSTFRVWLPVRAA